MTSKMYLSVNPYHAAPFTACGTSCSRINNLQMIKDLTLITLLFQDNVIDQYIIDQLLYVVHLYIHVQLYIVMHYYGGRCLNSCTWLKRTSFQARRTPQKRKHWQMFWFAQTDARRNDGIISCDLSNAYLLIHS